MVEEAAVSLAPTLLEAVLSEAVERIIKKVKAGKKITDSEVTLLLLDHMNKTLNKRIDETNKRIDDKFETLNKRIDETNKRIDDKFETLNKRIDELRKEIRELSKEISSIKSDIINLLKSKT